MDPAAGFLQPGDPTWWARHNTVLDPAAGLRLFELEGRLMGFVFSDPPTWAAVQAYPELETAGLHELVKYAGQLARPAGPHLTVRVFSGDARLLSVLRARGYRAPGTPSIAFERPLTDDLAGSGVAGFQLRAVRDDVTDLNARVELHRAVWQPSRFTLEAYQYLRAATAYRADLDLVAEALDGRLAAYVLGWLDPRTGTAEFEPVGTHPDFRGQGLAQAVLEEVAQRFHVLGVSRAIVYTSADNLTAVRLYESAGFRVCGEYPDVQSPPLG